MGDEIVIKSIYERVKDSISNFTFDIINNLGFLIPVLIGLVSFVSGVVNYIKFIVTGGYSSQVSATKEFGIFDGYD